AGARRAPCAARAGPGCRGGAGRGWGGSGPPGSPGAGGGPGRCPCHIPRGSSCRSCTDSSSCGCWSKAVSHTCPRVRRPVMTPQPKILATHLARRAYVSVRQSTLRPVLYATASQERQYGLVERAGTVGWPATQVVLIDDDQGQSGSRAHERPGFQDLRGALALDQVGIVLGLEVARLARNCSEWYRVLEVAALAGPLIGDIDGVYDPRDYHDRLLLGLKGALSEAELYTLKTRLHGGRLTKARQGTLVQMLPVGLVRPREGRVPLDPHLDVQTTLRTVF